MDLTCTIEQSTFKLSRLIKVIHTLTTSAAGAIDSSGSQTKDFQFIDRILEENLQRVRKDIDGSSQLQEDLGRVVDLLLLSGFSQSSIYQNEISIREKHVEVCIFLLYEVNGILKELSKFSTGEDFKGTDAHKLDPDSLSAPQVKTISQALQFIVALGVCPYLNVGIGIPVSQRMGPLQILLASVVDHETELSHLNRVQNLLPPAKFLCDMLDVQALRDIVINNYLHDLVSLLFQLRFSARNFQEQLKSSPANARGDASVSSKCSLTTGTLSLEEHHDCHVYGANSLPVFCSHSSKQPWTLTLVRDHCSQYIDKSVRLSSTQHILKTLLMLSGGGKSSQSSEKVRTPVWYKRTVACLLRDVIMVPPGVQHLIALLVTESSGVHDWEKCKAVARVIAQLPVTPSNVEQFHKSITGQLMTIIQCSTKSPSISIVRAVGATLSELTRSQPAIMESTCFAPLCEPLLKISAQNDTLSSIQENVIVSESVLNSCVNCLHKVLVLGQEPQSPLLMKLRKIVRVMFELLVASRKGISPLKSKYLDLICAYLGYCDPGESVDCIMRFLSLDKDHEKYPGLSNHVCLKFGTSGEIEAVWQQTEKIPQEQNINSWTQPVEAVMDILNVLQKDSVIPQLFIHLLQKLTSIVKSESNAAARDIALPPRLMNADKRSSQLVELREKVCLISLLAAVGDKYGDGVVSNGGHVLEFVKATLERCVQICQACPDEETMLFEWETVSMAMGLLTAVLSSGVDVGDQSHLLDDLLPLLTYISESDTADSRVKEMADDLKVAVATKGLVWAELSQMRHSSSKAPDDPRIPKQETKGKKLIEVLSEANLDDESKKDLHQNSNKISETISNTETLNPLEQALHELCDPLLPVRGHGLITLARLVEERNPEIENRQEILLKVFLENLAHTDSYIYLASVNGLAALSDLCPDQIIPCLTSELRVKCANSKVSSENSSKSQGEMVLKIAEAVVKATRRLGEMTPKYRDLLLPSILCGCQHPDALTRASCLSGLAEVCRLLRFALGPVLFEVVTCCRDVISSDPDPEPRKAAAMTFTLILQGLGKDTILTLDSALIEVYRTLKHAVTRDPEEGVRVHAALALEELDSIMREMLFVKPDLSKKISILGLK